LGIVLYEMLAGCKPFRGDSRQTSGNQRDRIRWEHLYLEPPPLSQYNSAVPASITGLIAYSLAKEPSARAPTARDFGQRWQTAITGQIPAAKPAGSDAPHTPAIRPTERYEDQRAIRQKRTPVDRRMVAVGVTVLIVVVALGLLMAVFSIQDKPALPDATPVATLRSATDKISEGPGPGTTRVDKCFTHTATASIQLIFCVEQITVRSDGRLKLNVSWMGQYQDETYQLKKDSDADNRNMYLTDNLGHRYDHTETGGAAATEVVLNHWQPVSGWFLFPSPASGATTLTFHDDDLEQLIRGINLSQ
jgi:hypothetical protein